MLLVLLFHSYIAEQCMILEDPQLDQTFISNSYLDVQANNRQCPCVLIVAPWLGSPCVNQYIFRYFMILILDWVHSTTPLRFEDSDKSSLKPTCILTTTTSPDHPPGGLCLSARSQEDQESHTAEDICIESASMPRQNSTPDSMHQVFTKVLNYIILPKICCVLFLVNSSLSRSATTSESKTVERKQLVEQSWLSSKMSYCIYKRDMFAIFSLNFHRVTPEEQYPQISKYPFSFG